VGWRTRCGPSFKGQLEGSWLGTTLAAGRPLAATDPRAGLGEGGENVDVRYEDTASHDQLPSEAPLVPGCSPGRVGDAGHGQAAPSLPFACAELGALGGAGLQLSLVGSPVPHCLLFAFPVWVCTGGCCRGRVLGP